MVKYKPKNPDCFQLCQFCFWYNEEKNQCDLYAPMTEEEKNDLNEILNRHKPKE